MRVNNLHQFGLAVHGFEADRGWLPPGAVEGAIPEAG